MLIKPSNITQRKICTAAHFSIKKKITSYRGLCS